MSEPFAERADALLGQVVDAAAAARAAAGDRADVSDAPVTKATVPFRSECDDVRSIISVGVC
jgi:hypothetical protein